MRAIAPPAGPGGSRPPNAFWCNSQPKICKSVKVLLTCTKHPCNTFMASECILGLCPCCKLLQWIRAESGYQVHLKPFFINSAVKLAPISTFILANVTFAVCYRPSVSLSSVCLSSVTFVRPTQAVQIFGNISTALDTLAIC